MYSQGRISALHIRAVVWDVLRDCSNLDERISIVCKAALSAAHVDHNLT